MVSKTIDVAWDMKYVMLQAPPVAPSASRSTREGGSPRLVPPSTPSAPRLSHCVLSDGPRSIHPLLVKTKPIKLLRRVLFLHVTRRYRKAACRKMTRFNPRLRSIVPGSMWRPDTGRFGGPTEHTGKTPPGGLGERRSDLVAASGRAFWGRDTGLQDSKISADGRPNPVTNGHVICKGREPRQPGRERAEVSPGVLNRICSVELPAVGQGVSLRTGLTGSRVLSICGMAAPAATRA